MNTVLFLLFAEHAPQFSVLNIDSYSVGIRDVHFHLLVEHDVSLGAEITLFVIVRHDLLKMLSIHVYLDGVEDVARVDIFG